MRRAAIASAIVIAIGSGIDAPAHDFWIEPSTFRPELNSVVQVALRVGEHFKGEPAVRNAAKIERFVIAGPGGEKPVIGKDGADPAGVVRPDQGGTYVLGYHNTPSEIELEAPKFEAYLREEGLESIIAARRERGESAKPGRERYARCAKSMLVVNGSSGPADGFDRILGFPLELIPEQNPSVASATGSQPVRLRYESKPLAGALVVAMHRDAPEAKVGARTDSEGRVSLKLDRPGVWLIKSVHMVRAADGADSDWLSLWASLTFERR